MIKDYKMIILNLGKESEKKVPVINQYQIWTGPRGSNGQGDDGDDSRFWGTEEASNFELACLKYELRNRLEWIDQHDRAGEYITDQDKEWFYNWRTNSNSWIGKYYPSKEEADRHD